MLSELSSEAQLVAAQLVFGRKHSLYISFSRYYKDNTINNIKKIYKSNSCLIATFSYSISLIVAKLISVKSKYFLPNTMSVYCALPFSTNTDASSFHLLQSHFICFNCPPPNDEKRKWQCVFELIVECLRMRCERMQFDIFLLKFPICLILRSLEIG